MRPAEEGDIEPIRTAAGMGWQAPGQKRNGRRWRVGLALWAFLAALGTLTAWEMYGYLRPADLSPSSIPSISSISGPGEWAMSQRTPDRNAFVGSVGAMPTGRIRWRFDANAPIYSPPAVVDGSIFLSTGNGRIVSLDATSGAVRWEYLAPGLGRSSPAVAGHSVFVGLEDGRVISLDRDTGGLRWEFNTDKPVLSSPVVYDEVVYVGSNDWRLYALDAETGDKQWSFTAENSIRSDPAIRAPVLAFTDMSTKLYVLNLSNGRVRLDYRVPISAEGGPVFDGERVYLADGGGRVRAVDWTQRRLPFERFYVWFRIQLFAWGISDTLPTQRGFVWFFRESDGEFVTTPVVAGGRVYAASLSGSLFALNQDTGKKVWEFQAQDSFEASPSVVGDTLFAGDSGGRLYAIDAITGHRRWDVDLGSGITATPVFAERLLYATTKDGILYALE